MAKANLKDDPMCERCLKMYQEQNPKLEAALDNATEGFFAVIDKFIAEMPEGIIETGGINTKTGMPFRFNEPKPAEIKDEEWAALVKTDKLMRRSLVAGLFAGYMSVRYMEADQDSHDAEAALIEGTLDMMGEGTKLGHITREALHMMKGKAN